MKQGEGSGLIDRRQASATAKRRDGPFRPAVGGEPHTRRYAVHPVHSTDGREGRGPPPPPHTDREGEDKKAGPPFTGGPPFGVVALRRPNHEPAAAGGRRC